MMARKRVLMVARSLQMGGVERNTVNLANTLAEQGHEVHILIFKRRCELTPDERVHVHVFDMDKVNRLTGIGLIYDALTRWFLATTLRGSGFVWKGLYGGWYFRLFLTRLEKRFGRFDKIIMRGQGAFEHVWSFSDPRIYQVVVSPLSKPDGSRLERWYTRLLYGNKRLVANSSGVLDSLKQRLAFYRLEAKSLSLIHNPCPINTIRRMAEEPAPVPEEPYIVHVARLTYQKNQALLLKAYKASGIDEKLVIVGGGQDEHALKRLAEDLGIAAKVIFVGQQLNPYPWMKHARAFVLSSYIEGFGLVLVESLASGTQVVSVDCPGGIRDILVEEQSRLIAEPTVEGLAEKIREALENPVTIKPEWYWRFDAEVVARQFLALQ
jgi:glycosyltransferase involved in cell wall biosynthesis